MSDSCDQISVELAAIKAEISKLQIINEEHIIQQAVARAEKSIIPQIATIAKSVVTPIVEAIVNNKINAIRQEINNLRQEFNNFKNQIGNLPQQITRLQQQIDNINRRINDPKSTDNQYQQLLQRVSKIESYINKLDAAGSEIKSLIQVIQQEVFDFLQILGAGFLSTVLGDLAKNDDSQ